MTYEPAGVQMAASFIRGRQTRWHAHTITVAIFHKILSKNIILLVLVRGNDSSFCGKQIAITNILGVNF